VLETLPIGGISWRTKHNRILVYLRQSLQHGAALGQSPLTACHCGQLLDKDVSNSVAAMSAAAYKAFLLPLSTYTHHTALHALQHYFNAVVNLAPCLAMPCQCHWVTHGVTARSAT
jgi:hypothetical protein